MGDDVCVAEVRAWADGLEEIRELIGPRFARSEPRENAVDYLRGLLSGAERKSSWTLSEQAGQAVPDRMQRLLSTTDWDPDAVRDVLRSYVVTHLGAAEGVLIVDETGFLKKGNRSAGVARQYSGTAGRIENAQIGVFLTYSTPAGRTFLDRELYRRVFGRAIVAIEVHLYVIVSGEAEHEVVQSNSIGVATNGVGVDYYEQVSFRPVTLVERLLQAG